MQCEGHVCRCSVLDGQVWVCVHTLRMEQGEGYPLMIAVIAAQMLQYVKEVPCVLRLDSAMIRQCKLSMPHNAYMKSDHCQPRRDLTPSRYCCKIACLLNPCSRWCASNAREPSKSSHFCTPPFEHLVFKQWLLLPIFYAGCCSSRI